MQRKCHLARSRQLLHPLGIDTRKCIADPNAGKWLLFYVLGPVVGAVLAAVSYHYMFILPGKRGVEGMEPVG